MKVTTEPSVQHSFLAHGWTADTPEMVRLTLRRQLTAAQALWPDLKDYEIVHKPRKPKK